MAIIPLMNYFIGGVYMNLLKVWDSYEADKRIEGFSSQTLKAYQLQFELLIRYLVMLRLGLLQQIT